jgi:hypothetical protein
LPARSRLLVFCCRFKEGSRANFYFAVPALVRSDDRDARLYPHRPGAAGLSARRLIVEETEKWRTVIADKQIKGG